MNLKIIGLAGTNGSGKDTVGQILAEKHGYLFVSATDLLRAELERRSLPPAREHMRALSAEWRRESGLGVLVDKVMAEYEKVKNRYTGVAMASMRNPGEADRIHDLGGTMVWVDANPRVRYERIKANAANRGGLRAVDDQKTFEQFLSEEQAEMHHSGDEATLNMAGVKEECDIFIENNSQDLAKFQHEIESSLELVK
ncbi:MAG TPA: AAA family ATPase [Candidatus Saccharimonadales bacterium]|nr:AAA family ATPase [Candidatus Saccharimonadales bacterium]